ncbi:hypothetical protein AGMMS50268_15900 [Spirochaetia bacterium]|nr:hypothetical protein AGMMS49546_21350 [Spirochaetia bacterium]GHV91087.1 hypothetical protein AGMMS50268_15900 [Spirochaetia bacterium]
MEENKLDREPRSRAPDCIKCIHFKITWETSFPRSCALFGIKCRNLPSVEVFRATGQHCPSFQQKESIK